jgi:hypothetical protein
VQKIWNGVIDQSARVKLFDHYDAKLRGMTSSSSLKVQPEQDLSVFTYEGQPYEERRRRSVGKSACGLARLAVCVPLRTCSIIGTDAMFPCCRHVPYSPKVAARGIKSVENHATCPKDSTSVTAVGAYLAVNDP